MASLSRNTTKPANQRKTARKTPRGSVKVQWHPDSTGEKCSAAQFLDISEGGLRIVVPTPMEDKVEISIFGPSFSKPIKRFANVIWSLRMEDGAFCVGLEFQRRLSFAEFLQIAIQVEAVRKQEQFQPQYEILVACRS